MAPLLLSLGLGLGPLSDLADPASLVMSEGLAPHLVRRVTDPGSTSGPGDGVYGRFSGDLAFRLGAGLEWDMQAQVGRPLLNLEWIGYQTLGAYVGFRQAVSKNDVAENVLSIGALISPLFIWRWSEAKQLGRAYLDLMIDSLTLAPGLVLATPRSERFASAPGLELGLVAGVPFLPRAEGPWLKVRVDAFTGRQALGFESSWGASCRIYLEWQGFVYAGLLGSDSH